MSSLPSNTVSIESVFKTVRTRNARDWSKESLSKFCLRLIQLTHKKQLTVMQTYCLMVSLASKVASNELCLHCAELVDGLSDEKEDIFDISELEALGDALIIASEAFNKGSKSSLSLPLLGESESVVVQEIEIGTASVLEKLIVFFLATSRAIQSYHGQLVQNALSWVAEVLQLSSCSEMLTPRCLLVALQLIDYSTVISWSLINDTVAAMCRLPVLHMPVQSMNETDLSSLSVVESAFKELTRVMNLPTINNQTALVDFATQSLIAVIKGVQKLNFDLDCLGINSMLQYGIEETLTSSQCKVLGLCYILLDLILQAVLSCSTCAKLTWRQMSVICFDLKSLAMVLSAVRRSRDESGHSLIIIPKATSNSDEGVVIGEDSVSKGTRFWQDAIMKSAFKLFDLTIPLEDQQFALQSLVEQASQVLDISSNRQMQLVCRGLRAWMILLYLQYLPINTHHRGEDESAFIMRQLEMTKDHALLLLKNCSVRNYQTLANITSHLSCVNYTIPQNEVLLNAWLAHVSYASIKTPLLTTGHAENFLSVRALSFLQSLRTDMMSAKGIENWTRETNEQWQSAVGQLSLQDDGVAMVLKGINDEMICEALDIQEKWPEDEVAQFLQVENGMHTMMKKQFMLTTDASALQSPSWVTSPEICEGMRATCLALIQQVQSMLGQVLNEQQQQNLLLCQTSIVCLSIVLNSAQGDCDGQQLQIIIATAVDLATSDKLDNDQISQSMLNITLLATANCALKNNVAGGSHVVIAQLIEAITNTLRSKREELTTSKVCSSLAMICRLFAADLPEVTIAALHILVVQYLVVRQQDSETTFFIRELILAFQPVLSSSKVADQLPNDIMDLIIFPAIKQLQFDPAGLIRWILILLQSLFSNSNNGHMQSRQSHARSVTSNSSHFLTRYGGLFLWKVIEQNDQHLFLALAACYKNGVLMLMMPPGASNSTIIAAYPSFLYFAFMSPAHQQRDANGWNTILKTWLRQIRQIFTLEDEATIEGDEVIAESAAIDQVVAMIVWSLGSPSTATYERAEMAWKHMARWKAAILQQQRQPDTQITGSGTSRSPNDAICSHRLAADHFLSIISQLLQHEWIQQSDEEQARSVICLQAYLRFLATVDLIKFLPKVLNILDASMSSGSAIVRLQAVNLTAYLIQTLPAAELKENIPSLVMGLTNTFEPFSDRVDLVEEDENGGSNTVHTAQLIAEPLRKHQKSLLVVKDTNYDELNNQARFKSRQGATRIFKELFIGEDSVWKDLLASLPLLPVSALEEELQAVNDLQQELKAEISQPDQFSNLCDLLQKEHPALREAAVNNIILCFREGRVNIYEALSASRRNAFDNNTFSNESIIIKLIRSVLSLAGREQVDRVKDACARCIGEIGALDTSLVQIVITDKLETGRATAADQLLPWKVNGTSFALHLLTEFLVPELKSAQKSTSQDRCCYAIQQLLRFLADPELNEDPDSMAMDTATLDVDQTSSAGTLPEHLRVVFSRSKILEIVEPFWSSKYVLQDKFVPSVPPIYRPGMSCQRWIFLWCRYLISICESPLKRVFEAVKGVLRYRLDLCQLLLPCLIVDLLVNGSYVHFDPIITELMSVLNGSPDTEQHQGVKVGELLANVAGSTGGIMIMSDSLQVCVQSVFALLDRFTSWISRRRMAQAAANLAAEKEKQSVKSKESATVVPAVIPNEVGAFGSMNDVVDALETVIKALPLSVLSDAASSIRAHARALRYTEENVRIRQLEASKQQGQGEDEAQQQQPSKANAVPYRLDDNGLRPSLTVVELDALSDIYASLEDSDSVQGVQASRRMLGFPEAYSHRVVELELNDEWLNALLEYELVQNSPVYQKSLQTLAAKSSFQINSTFDDLGRRLARKVSSINHRITEAGETKETESASRAKKRRTSSTSSAAAERGGEASVASNELSTPFVKELISADEIAAIERGKLRCLVELGHLESVIFQAQGKEGSLAELQRTLIPLGAEAAWRLSKWDELDGFLNHSSADRSKSAMVSNLFSDSDHYQLRLGRVLSSMHRADDTAFAHELRIARLQTMSSLSATSMESYGRSVPMIVRLQTLSELEAGHELLLSCHSKSSTERADLGREWITNSCWKQRMDFMPESIVQKSQVMAVRRSILALCGLIEQVADNWLDMSHFYSKLGRYDSARMALKNAEQCGMNSETILIEECKILKEQGHVHRALTLLEPNPIDLTALNAIFKRAQSTSSSGSKGQQQSRAAVYPEFIDTAAKRRSLAEKIHLATQLMVEAKQSQGTVIIERYRTVTLIDSNWSQAYFDYGRYYEFLYNDMVAKEQATESEGASISSSSNGGGNNGSKQSYHYIIKAVEKYGNCLVSRQDGRSDDLIMQALPRLLTLWLSFTSLTDNNSTESNAVVPVSRASSTGSRGNRNSSNSSAASMNSSLQVAQAEMNRKIDHFSHQIDAAAWFHGLPQMVSRILHRNKTTVDLLIRSIIKTLVAYPKQGIWHIASLIHSHNTERTVAADKIIKEAVKILCSSTANNGEDATMLLQASSVFGNLIKLAEHQTKDKKIRWHFSNDSSNTKINLGAFLVPTQNVLMNGDAIASGSFYSGQQMFILKFNEIVDVASSKAKPKTLTLQTTCGKTIRFLCKQEKDGDLRKDARLMEFNTTVNRLLQLGPQGRKRKLRLRTFAVICLNEECGILEWVDNTVCLRHVINEAHSFSSTLSNANDYPNISYRDIYQQYLDIQQQHDGDVDRLVTAYKAMMNDCKYRPCFHRWFLNKFSDPTAWLEARNAYTRSAAVWSGVGHVIGLGDRHTENILIDVNSGECVHVDFDCLFDKGLTLAKPEIIPFRLTSNMVDAMGVVGVEGCYRRSLEVCLEVLRGNKEALLSVLEPFLRDPTVAWGRSGRAQQRSEAALQSNASNRQLSSFHDHENKEANEMLNKVANRLSGVYNLMHPHRAKFVDFAHRHNRGIIPSRGLGASKEEQLPLSVAGQTQRLIEEATCLENLSQLYIGWQPWV